MNGPIRKLLCDDHVRLQALLDRATSGREIDLAAYDAFRGGLLRHIAMEEKILVPAAERGRGERHPLAARLRLEHGAIAALLVPIPNPSILRTLCRVLEHHDHLEEDPGGLYDLCEEWIGEEQDQVLAQLEAQPEVPLSPPVPGERVLEATRRALVRAGFEMLGNPETARE